MSKLFDANEWQKTCENESLNTVKSCGCIHDVYVESYSCKVDTLVSSLAEEHHEKAYAITKKHGDFATPPERMKTLQWSRNHGYCEHGLDPENCPVGYGDLEEYTKQ